MSTIDAMIASGQLVINLPTSEYFVLDQGGYTYISTYISTVPEPTSLVLACVGGAGIIAGMKWRRRRAAR